MLSLLKTLVMNTDCFYSMLTDIGEAGEALLLAAFLFNLGEELGCGEGPRSCSGGVESLGVELLGGEGDNHQNSFALPLSK